MLVRSFLNFAVRVDATVNQKNLRACTRADVAIRMRRIVTWRRVEAFPDDHGAVFTAHKVVHCVDEAVVVGLGHVAFGRPLHFVCSEVVHRAREKLHHLTQQRLQNFDGRRTSNVDLRARLPRCAAQSCKLR